LTSWQSAVEDTVTGLEYDLVDAEKSAGGLLRVFIDQPAGSGKIITVDDCERVTRQLQHVLEVEGCAYERLEVSSPGLDRPLKKAADYERFTGEQVEVTLKMPFKGRKKYRGRLESAEAGWRLVLIDETHPRPAAKRAAGKRTVATTAAAAPAKDESQAGSEGSELALDFSLDEVREARLVPVLDFKGHRFAAPPASHAPAGTGPNDEVDGGRIQ
jgi:ribosome maturation factor RimP